MPRDKTLCPVLPYFPMLMAVVGGLSFSPCVTGSGFRQRSPRKCTPAIMTVLPPSMMFCFPSMIALLEILLPVSLKHLRNMLRNPKFAIRVRHTTYCLDILSLCRPSPARGGWTRLCSHVTASKPDVIVHSCYWRLSHVADAIASQAHARCC